MTFLKIDKYNPEKKEFVAFPFYKNDLPLSVKNSALWGMTLKSAGNMRFRWNEKNSCRDAVLKKIASCFDLNGEFISGTKNNPLGTISRFVVPVELIHSKIVVDVKNADDTKNVSADGIITQNKMIMPVVTVADCVPLYLYDSVSGVFGVVHSGWKGTGIVQNAINIMCKNYGTQIKDVCVAIGAHIHDCCYNVNEERALFFTENFRSDCVTKVDCGSEYMLSLQKANLFVLEKCGILPENIVILDECTCCNEIFGSNRRENPTGKSTFTVQAAFVMKNN